MFKDRIFEVKFNQIDYLDINQYNFIQFNSKIDRQNAQASVEFAPVGRMAEWFKAAVLKTAVCNST